MTFLLLLLLTSSTATAGASTALQALRDSASTTIHNLTNQVVLQDAERSRQEAVRVLLTDPVESFPVLAKFVSELSAKERTALQGNESEEAAATYAVDSTELGNFRAKYDACNVIATLYSRLNDSQKEDALRVLDESFTPSASGNDDAAHLFYALAVIGRDAVPVLLNLTKSRIPNIRRIATQELNDLAETAAGPNGLRPEKLDCNLKDSANCNTHTWSRWWSDYGRQHSKFPTMPNYFSMPPPKP